MKDDFLFDRGWGVAINPGENSVDWVFSYGDIVNLHINNEFFTTTDYVELQSVEAVSANAQIMLAQPSESYLPIQVRQALKLYLQSTGVKRPKVMLVCRQVEGTVIQQLAFNVFPEDFSSAEELNYRLQQISWFLPKHYIVLALPKKSNLTSNFADL